MKRLALLAVLLLAAGCGGSAPKSFSAAADDACVRAGKKIDSLGTPADLGGYRKWAGKALAIARDYLAELARLDPPDRLRAKAAAYIAFEREAAMTIRQLQRLAETPGPEQRTKIVRLAGTLGAKAAREKELERALGMTQCAKF